MVRLIALSFVVLVPMCGGDGVKHLHVTDRTKNSPTAEQRASAGETKASDTAPQRENSDESELQARVTALESRVDAFEVRLGSCSKAAPAPPADSKTEATKKLRVAAAASKSGRELGQSTATASEGVSDPLPVPVMSSNPWPDYLEHWKDDSRVLKAVACDSLENIFANRLHGWDRYDPKYHAYEPELDAFRVRIYQGQKSLPIAAQWITTWEYPGDTPWGEGVVTICWSDCWPYNTHSGKVYQLSDDSDLEYEYKHTPGLGDSGWVVPHWRTYSTPVMQQPYGERGLVWNSPETGAYAWHQPALYPRGHRNYGDHILKDHIGFRDNEHPLWNSPQYDDRSRCYLKRVNSAQWHFHAVTFDFRQGEGELRIHHWEASQGSPRDAWPHTPLTKIVDAPQGNPDHGKGFLHDNRDAVINQFWVEINNSRGEAPEDTQFYFKDLLVIAGVTGEKVWRAAGGKTQ